MGAGTGKTRRVKFFAPHIHETSSQGVKLWLDDIRTPPDETWTWVKTVADAKALMKKEQVSIASLDHDLGIPNEDELKETGYWFVLWMAEYNIWPSEKVMIHSGNVVGVTRMRGVVMRYGPYDK